MPFASQEPGAPSGPGWTVPGWTVPGWTVLVPLKRTAQGKSRLAAFAEHRAALALAMAADTVAAALAARRVSAVVVVTDDDRGARELGLLGARCLADLPGAGLNAALRHAAGRVRRSQPYACVAALPADLPALLPADLDIALAAAPPHRAGFVADAAGSGTTLWCAPGGVPFAPRYGAGSGDAHRRAGAVPLDLPVPVPGLRRDVDTPADLHDAARLGLGPRTALAAAAAGLLPRTAGTRPGPRAAPHPPGGG